jgi:hypothetical protein
MNRRAKERQQTCNRILVSNSIYLCSIQFFLLLPKFPNSISLTLAVVSSQSTAAPPSPPPSPSRSTPSHRLPALKCVSPAVTMPHHVIAASTLHQAIMSATHSASTCSTLSAEVHTLPRLHVQVEARSATMSSSPPVTRVQHCLLAGILSMSRSIMNAAHAVVPQCASSSSKK